MDRKWSEEIMGDRPSSYLGYGIAWDEGEESEHYTFESMYDLIEEVEKSTEVCAEMWAHECSQCLFIYIEETYHRNDWDGLGEVDMKRLHNTESEEKYDQYLKEVCDRLKLNYKKPKYHLLSYYG